MNVRERKLQDILFTTENKQVDNQLFFSSNKAIEITSDNSMKASKGSVICFESYFNSFSIAKWKKYTHIEKIELELCFCGKAEITLMAHKILYGEKNTTVVYKCVVENDKFNTIRIPYDEIPNVISYSFSITVLSDTFELMNGCYVSNKELENNFVNLAIVFTTYNREQYLLNNIANICNVKDENLHIYVVDNASNLSLNNDAKITVIPNRNVGGAGGFARGMIQIIEDQSTKQFTHCLLMDDDAFIDSNILKRLILFLQFIKEEYTDAFVSGAMLRKDLSYYQVESGALWNDGKIKSNGHGVDLRSAFMVLNNNMESESDYAAWWFCTIPIKYIRNDNLPLPVFVFNDDVDYGIRNGCKIITLNGICVWHDAFESKRNAMRCYYESRNQLIVNSCNKRSLEVTDLIKDLKKTIMMEINLYQYENAQATLEGIQDFLKGPEWLAKIDAEEFNRTIIKKNIKLRRYDTLSIDYDWYRLCCTIKDCDWLHGMVRRLTQNGYYLKADRDIVLPLYATNIEAGYRARKIIYYDEITGMGFEVKRNKIRKKQILKEYRKVSSMLKSQFKKISSEYEQSYEYLISREQWDRYLNLQSANRSK